MLASPPNLFGSPQQGVFKLLLSEIRRKWKTTNMGLERLLKDIKMAFPSFYGPAFAETTSLMACVAQMWRAHLDEFGKNPFASRPDDLIEKGTFVEQFPRMMWKLK